MIYIDTREKKNKHIVDYMDRHGVQYEHKKLDVADYCSDGKVLIERKANLLELAGNITKENGRRIKAELERVPPGAQLVFLVEENIGGLDDVPKWKSERTKLLGTTMHRYLVSWQKKHGIVFLFCSKKSSGRIICQLLGGEKEC